MKEESKQELTNSMIRGLVEASKRAIELIEKNHPEIAKKLKDKDVPLEQKITELQKIVEVHVTRKGMQVYVVRFQKEGEI